MAPDLPAPITVLRRLGTPTPTAFLWHRRRWRIDRVLQRWAIDTGWWSVQSHIDCHYLGVLAESRIFHLFYDCPQRRGVLERAL